MRRQISGILFLSVCLLLITGYIFIYKYKSEHPNAEWNTSPDNLVISYELGPTEISYGYIPDFQVWGDGRIVWVKYEGDGTRKVYQEYLSQDELKSLIEQFVKAGYFYWNSGGGSSFDFMRIQLLNQKRDRQLDANREISQLVGQLKSGIGVSQTEFVPTIGYLYVVPVNDMEEYHGLNIQPKYSWPRNEHGLINFDIVTIKEERKIMGDELKFFWEVANNHSPFVEANGDIYWIAIEIPKITY